MSRRFQAVVLDLFDTLVKWSPGGLPTIDIDGRAIHSTLPWHFERLERTLGSRFDRDAYLRAYLDVVREIDVERRATEIEITCHERFRRTLERLGWSDGLAAELTRIHMGGVRAVTKAPPEYVAVVERVARSYRLGLLSNFDDSETGRAILADTGVGHLFEAVVISADLAVRKPHPLIFRTLLDRLGLEPREVLFVGDTAREDVCGAHRAGIPVVWLSDGKGAFPPEIAPPEFTAPNLAALPSVLAGLERE